MIFRASCWGTKDICAVSPLPALPGWKRSTQQTQPRTIPVVIRRYRIESIRAKGVTNTQQAGVSDVLQYVDGPQQGLHAPASPRVAVFSAHRYVRLLASLHRVPLKRANCANFPLSPSSTCSCMYSAIWLSMALRSVFASHVILASLPQVFDFLEQPIMNEFPDSTFIEVCGNLSGQNCCAAYSPILLA